MQNFAKIAGEMHARPKCASINYQSHASVSLFIRMTSRRWKVNKFNHLIIISSVIISFKGAFKNHLI